MKKPIVILAGLFVITLFGPATEAYIEINDGISHLVDDDTYKDEHIRLDWSIANEPATHLELVDGGTMSSITTYNSSTATVSGGYISSFLRTEDDSKAIISDGSLGYGIEASGSSMITVSGGTIGTIAFYEIIAESSGMIYLNGSDFSVDGHILSIGESLRNYGVSYNIWLTGTITGTLQDGSSLNNIFFIEEATNADIMVVPEPATLLLLGLGAVMLRKNC